MDFLALLKIIFIAIVEGITEWLPVSSTGHLILCEALFDMKTAFGPNGYAVWEFFLVFVQFAAILAVIVVFFKDLWPWTKKKDQVQRKEIYWTWLYILIACVPAAIAGLFLDDLLDQYLYNYWTVTVTLIFYGLVFLLVEWYLRKTGREPKINSMKDFTWKTALIIGLAQVLALIPGTSRSGITIIAALLIGVNRETGTKFTFYVSIPVMLGASLLKGFKFFYEGNTLTPHQIIYFIVGALVAFLISLIAIKFLTVFVKNHTFRVFGLYRVCFGSFMLFLIIFLPAVGFPLPDIAPQAVQTVNLMRFLPRPLSLL